MRRDYPTKRQTFYKNASRVTLAELDSIIDEIDKDIKENSSILNFYDFNSLFQDVTLQCVLDDFSEWHDKYFSEAFGYYATNDCFIVTTEDGKKVDSYAILIRG